MIPLQQIGATVIAQGSSSAARQIARRMTVMYSVKASLNNVQMSVLAADLVLR